MNLALLRAINRVLARALRRKTLSPWARFQLTEARKILAETEVVE